MVQHAEQDFQSVCIVIQLPDPRTLVCLELVGDVGHVTEDWRLVCQVVCDNLNQDRLAVLVLGLDEQVCSLVKNTGLRCALGQDRAQTAHSSARGEVGRDRIRIRARHWAHLDKLHLIRASGARGALVRLSCSEVGRLDVLKIIGLVGHDGSAGIDIDILGLCQQSGRILVGKRHGEVGCFALKEWQRSVRWWTMG